MLNPSSHMDHQPLLLLTLDPPPLPAFPAPGPRYVTVVTPSPFRCPAPPLFLALFVFPRHCRMSDLKRLFCLLPTLSLPPSLSRLHLISVCLFVRLSVCVSMCVCLSVSVCLCPSLCRSLHLALDKTLHASLNLNQSSALICMHSSACACFHSLLCTHP
jgi:hypothetical protein